MTKYKATIERKVVKTLVLTYEFESRDSVDNIKELLSNGEADSYVIPSDEECIDEVYTDKMLTLEPLNEGAQ